MQEQEMLTPDNAPDDEWERGWYEYAGGLRYYDGNGWTDHYAPPARQHPPSQINYVAITCAVAIGMVLGWLFIWILAQAAPDTFYWPVKFVVEDLPEGF